MDGEEVKGGGVEGEGEMWRVTFTSTGYGLPHKIT